MSQATTATPADETPPQEPARSPNMQSEIDRLVGNTLPANVRVNNDGTTEQIPMARNEMSKSGDVAPPPSIEDISDQMHAHQARADQIKELLGQQIYSRTTGQPEGPRITGQQRAALERELALKHDEQMYLVRLLQETSEARTAWNRARAAQAAGEDATPSLDAMSEAVRREAAIRELSETQLNGRAIGRVEAARQYDEAALRAKADRLARGK